MTTRSYNNDFGFSFDSIKNCVIGSCIAGMQGDQDIRINIPVLFDSAVQKLQTIVAYFPGDDVVISDDIRLDIDT